MHIPQAVSSVLFLLLYSAVCASRVFHWHVSNTSSGHVDTEAVTAPQVHSDTGISPRVMLDEVHVQNWTGTQKELLAVSANHGFVISKCGRVVEKKTDGDVMEIFITVTYVGGNGLFPDKGRILQVRDNIQGLKLLQPNQTSTSQDYQEFDIDLSNRNVSEVSYIAILDPALAMDGVNISLPASVMRTQSGIAAEIATSTLFIVQIAKFQTIPRHGLHFAGFVVAFVMVGLAVICISLTRQNTCWGACSKSTRNTQVQQDVQSACSASVCAREGQLTGALACLLEERLESEELYRERKQAVDMLIRAILETFGKTVRPTQCLDMRHVESPIQAYEFLSQLMEKFDIPRNAVQHALCLFLPLHSETELHELLRLVHPNTCSEPNRIPVVGVHKERVDEGTFRAASGLLEHVRASIFASCPKNANVDSPRRKQRILQEAQLQPAKLVSRHSHDSDKAMLPPQLKHSEPSLESETMILDSSGTQERIFVFRSRPEVDRNPVISHKKKKRNFLNYKSSNIVDVTT